ncbi:hypothetical protein TWF225_010726 [Orbilia oligospora]|uniref:DUF7587 domain-containing protein n=1 Tax=Orbilia oligospora TaxID=2813651 RepID=A0A8H2HUG5_ORBOL|nr:hypothetical protein TWF225_010726 [Orbilia oligospora]KAF3242495.1 hypothetical protein TWF128_010465 [Orbilia oligospora]KAF3253662.1 hypothetical protein TWF217_007445 [Orbilia oligospora]KAF3273966.1 hypothetical protein TWF132_003975 [Orbilia oligospora]TGJ72946.1 hypothetical protein EYR41_000070 [Orbilia oligospora]
MSEDTIIPPLPPSSLPEYLYRIDYPRSWTAFSPNILGFRAKDLITMGPATISQLTNHLQWKINIPSRFISTLSSKSYAISWARSLDQYKDIETRNAVRLMTIKTGGLSGPLYAYNLKQAFEGAGVTLPEELREYVKDEEYVILYGIPASQVVRIEGIDSPIDSTTTETTEICSDSDSGLNMADPRRGFGDFIREMEQLCTEMKLLVESFNLLSSHTQATIYDAYA